MKLCIICKEPFQKNDDLFVYSTARSLDSNANYSFLSDFSENETTVHLKCCSQIKMPTIHEFKKTPPESQVDDDFDLEVEPEPESQQESIRETVYQLPHLSANSRAKELTEALRGLGEKVKEKDVAWFLEKNPDLEETELIQRWFQGRNTLANA